MGLALTLPPQYAPFLRGSYTEPSAVEQPAEALATVLSPSQVRTLMDCSARWWFKYGLGLPDPPNANLALGTAVHTALAANFAQKIETEKDLPTGEVREIFRTAWEHVLEEAVLRDEDDAAGLAAQGEQLVAKYMQLAAPRIQPAAVEVHVEGKVAGVKVQGRVDVVERCGRVRDIKTSSRRSADVSNEQVFQLATYVPLIEGATGHVVVDQLVRTKEPQLVQLERRLTSGDLDATRKIYPHAQTVARSGFYMPNRTSTLCSRKHCPFWSSCEKEFGGKVAAQ